ncbi:DUF4276 family protein [Saccharibacillus sp. CPCC 101409]|uniref:DUF4276 family protein n=1 Tax=Saccharibacillus sp. CPCC 101409 TaxID=3058041 RepID=UPI002671C3EC|nr:DUF4276 family protein [Saccharibacillus sp. CPCC 101409]MDO3411257.1 DUF4276 family protein [Saccharibacillus sp. CPCC 101409]
MLIKKVLIYGEGPTDVGTVDPYGNWSQGCIVRLLQKINPQISLEFIKPPHKKEITQINTLKKKGQPRLEGHAKIIQKLFIYAGMHEMKYDIIAYYGDTDRETGTRNSEVQARSASRDAYNEAVSAFSFLRINGIPIIPLRMLESWLLSDPEAFLKAFNRRVTLPGRPELLWGDRHNPNSDFPKNKLQKILESIGQSASRETFCEIVENINIDTMEKNCPISFPPFIEKAQELLR